MASFASQLVAIQWSACHRGEDANVLPAMPKDPACPVHYGALGLQTLQTATSSVARAVWCGSGVIADGMTECSGAEVAER